MSNVEILVIDDEAIVRDSCKRILEAEGFEVLLATSVEEALSVIEAQTNATPRRLLLLLDVKMPVPDGMYLLQKVNELWPELPVIVMSGYPTHGTLKSSRDLKAAAFIAKPFTPEELLDTVKTVIQKGQIPLSFTLG